jgi:hypothetical protein
VGFELRTLDIDDLSVAQKQNVRYATSIGEGNVLSEDKPLAGVHAKDQWSTT